MRRIAVFLTLSLLSFTACDDGTSDTESGSESGSGTESTSNTATDLGEPDLVEVTPRAAATAHELELEFEAAMETAFAEFRATGREPRVCTPNFCANCKFTLIPPSSTCWVSTPKHGCSGGCNLTQGCGGSCW